MMFKMHATRRGLNSLAELCRAVKELPGGYSSQNQKCVMKMCRCTWKYVPLWKRYHHSHSIFRGVPWNIWTRPQLLCRYGKDVNSNKTDEQMLITLMDEGNYRLLSILLMASFHNESSLPSFEFLSSMVVKMGGLGELDNLLYLKDIWLNPSQNEGSVDLYFDCLLQACSQLFEEYSVNFDRLGPSVTQLSCLLISHAQHRLRDFEEVLLNMLNCGEEKSGKANKAVAVLWKSYIQNDMWEQAESLWQNYDSTSRKCQKFEMILDSGIQELLKDITGYTNKKLILQRLLLILELTGKRRIQLFLLLLTEYCEQRLWKSASTLFRKGLESELPIPSQDIQALIRKVERQLKETKHSQSKAKVIVADENPDLQCLLEDFSDFVAHSKMTDSYSC